MKKALRLFLSISLVVATLMLYNQSEAQSTNSTYKYKKNGWFQYDVDSIKLYWVEECTSEEGGQCTEASGKFRYDVTFLMNGIRGMF